MPLDIEGGADRRMYRNEALGRFKRNRQVEATTWRGKALESQSPLAWLA